MRLQEAPVNFLPLCEVPVGCVTGAGGSHLGAVTMRKGSPPLAACGWSPHQSSQASEDVSDSPAQPLCHAPVASPQSGYVGTRETSGATEPREQFVYADKTDNKAVISNHILN